MKILGIESSSLVASVGVVDDDSLIGEYTVNLKKTHSQTLLPMIDEVIRMLELELADLDGIAVSAGPGSFTGLRIGSATAKGLGLALKKPLIHIPTVDAMAYGLYGTSHTICPLMDARRNQVYTGLYQNDGKFRVLLPQRAAAIDEILAEINNRGSQVIFLGDGVPVAASFIRETLTVPYSFAPAFCNRQRGGVVAALGREYFLEGKIEAAADHKPDYLRLSQAERERLEKERS